LALKQRESQHWSLIEFRNKLERTIFEDVDFLETWVKSVISSVEGRVTHFGTGVIKLEHNPDFDHQTAHYFTFTAPVYGLSPIRFRVLRKGRLVDGCIDRVHLAFLSADPNKKIGPEEDEILYELTPFELRHYDQIKDIVSELAQKQY
jgi:hypothetical protein